MSTIETDARRIRRTSSGSVILREIDGKWHALLLRAWSHWDFPKGNVESGETLMDAAIREVQEETGIKDLSFPWGSAFARTGVYSRDKVAYYSIATCSTDEVVLAPNPETGLKEHEEFRWVPWSQVPSLLSPRLVCIVEWVENVTRMHASISPGLAAPPPMNAAHDVAPTPADGAPAPGGKKRGLFGRSRRR